MPHCRDGKYLDLDVNVDPPEADPLHRPEDVPVVDT